MPNQYERLGVVPLDRVITAIKDPEVEKTEEFGVSIKVHSMRLRTFTRGLTCSTCGLEATHFAVETSVKRRYSKGAYTITPDPNGWHLNLYGIDRKGREILFTADHIVPKSLGGKDKDENLRTMCGPCNWERGNGLPQKIIGNPTGLNTKEKRSFKNLVPHLSEDVTLDELVTLRYGTKYGDGIEEKVLVGKNQIMYLLNKAKLVGCLPVKPKFMKEKEECIL